MQLNIFKELHKCEGAVISKQVKVYIADLLLFYINSI